ncbi:MAG: L,D-transpeptidase, partial [Actinomycetes bacterium]
IVVPWSSPIVLAAVHGRIVSVTVSVTPASTGLTGTVSASGATWTSQSTLVPATSYALHVDLSGPGGTRTQVLQVRTNEATTLLTPLITPGPGNTVGVGFPIMVTFNHPVTDRATVERAMTVTSSIPVTGAWHWFSSTEVHYRPQSFWPAHDTINIDVNLVGVQAGPGLWGHGHYFFSFSTGNAWVSYANAGTHTLTVTENGHVVHVFPAALGMPTFPTSNGIFVEQEKYPQILMTSCSAGITCSKTNSNYYSLEVYWDTRLSDGGIFVHAAPWDHLLGQANDSHGCIHVSTTDAQWFYNHANRGDVVIVSHSYAPPSMGDPGQMDWNMPWSAWLAGSALG